MHIEHCELAERVFSGDLWVMPREVHPEKIPET